MKNKIAQRWLVLKVAGEQLWYEAKRALHLGPAFRPGKPTNDPSGKGQKSKVTSKESVDVSSLHNGDVLEVVTQNTVYSFRMEDSREAIVSTNHEDRPSGPVRLRGCTRGSAAAIIPDSFFCGGNLEFFFKPTGKLHKTSAIQALRWMSLA